MGLAGVYIDKNNNCQPVDENGKNLPAAMAAEMKKYKLCKISFDGSNDPATVSKKLTKQLADWDAQAKANRAAIGPAEKAALAAEKAAKVKAAADEKNELAAEDKVHDQNKTNINNSGQTAGQKAALGRDEDERHRAKCSEIYKKRAKAEDDAPKAYKAAVAAAQAKLPQPPAVKETCTETDDCPKNTCKAQVMYILDVNNAPQVKVKSDTIENVGQFSQDHFYFCSCGLK